MRSPTPCCFWRRTIPATSRGSSCSSMAARLRFEPVNCKPSGAVRRLFCGARALRPQNILVHLAAVEMKERPFRIVAQGAGGEAFFEFVEDISGHRMQVGERLRSDLDPDQFHEFSVGMDHALHMV